MGRAPCCDKVGLKRGRWTAEEDRLLMEYIKAHGEGAWRSLPKNAGLLRCGKSCRLRWVNYLREDLKRGNISPEEEETILKLQATLGNRWSLIAGHLPGRTDNEIKNHWNAHLSKKLAAARTATAVGAGGGTSGVHEEDDDGGEVCSEDGGSTVVDGDKDDMDDATDNAVTSSSLAPNGGRKDEGKYRRGGPGKHGESAKRKRKDREARQSSKRDPSDGVNKKEKEKDIIKGSLEKEGNEDDVGGSRKRKRSCGGQHGCCQHSCGSSNTENRAGDTTTDGETGNKEVVVKKESDKKSKTKKKKKKKKKKNMLTPANQPVGTEAEAASNEQGVDVGAAGTERLPTPPSKAKAKPEVQCERDVDVNGGGADCCAAGCGSEGLGRSNHVEYNGMKMTDRDLLVGSPSHTEDLIMEVDIDSDGGGLLVPSGAVDLHDSFLLDYLDMSCTDAKFCPTVAPPSDDFDSIPGGWPGSSVITAPMTTMGDEAMASTVSGCSTSSSYVDLSDGQLCGGGGGAAGMPMDDTIGSLPWEAEEDFFRLLSEFAGDMEAAGQALVEESPPTLPHQPTMTMKGAHSSIAGCGGDDVFADDTFQNLWILADMFLS